MLITDPALPKEAVASIPYAKTLCSLAGALLVVVVGKFAARETTRGNRPDGFRHTIFRGALT